MPLPPPSARRVRTPVNLVRTTRSTVTFRSAFTLNDEIGELSAGTYDIEVDEDEILAAERTAYRRVAMILIVRTPGTTRSVAIDPAQLDQALERDQGVEPCAS